MARTGGIHEDVPKFILTVHLLQPRNQRSAHGSTLNLISDCVSTPHHMDVPMADAVELEIPVERRPRLPGVWFFKSKLVPVRR